MKKLFLSFVALICATLSFAQSQIATLTHGDEIKTFYGAGSFKEALAAADHGDIITLSSGQFEATDINKAITLRGAGMVELSDELGYHAPTLIQGRVTLSSELNSEKKLSIDGIKFENRLEYTTLVNPVFTKCNFAQGLTYNKEVSNPSIKNATLINCRTNSVFEIINSSTVSCVNSLISSPSTGTESVNCTFEFINCITSVGPTVKLNYCTFKNCYILEAHNSTYTPSLPKTCLVAYCCSNGEKIFNNLVVNINNKMVPVADMFETYNTSYPSMWTDNHKYILKEEAASTYLGDDGTQIGIYGGNMPYNERISMPRITKCNVANKSTADGKLSVDIQVEAAQ